MHASTAPVAWILLVEDEARLAATIQRGLAEEGFRVDVAPDAEVGARLAREHAFDALIVDWRLPGGDGRTLVQGLRDEGFRQPVLMLTALADVEHRVAGLDAGADDYLAKPFVFDELVARLRALLRRPPLAAQAPALEVGRLRIDRERRRAVVVVDSGDELLNLRPKEFALLELLAAHQGAVVAREVIADRVWGDAPYVSDNALDVTISGLRQRLADVSGAASGVPRIDTARGVGYCLQLP